MGFIFENVELTGSIKKKTISALFDSGADSNHIRYELFDGESIESIGFNKIGLYTTIILGNGQTIGSEQVEFEKLSIKNQVIKKPTFCISDSLPYDMIIGADLMQSFGIILDPPNERFYFSK